MYEGYLRFGGNVIVNNQLTAAYARSRDCIFASFANASCDTLNDALDEDWAYAEYPVEDLPWYDARLPDTSSRFFGVYGVDFSLVQDSTRQLPTVEGITDGGVIGRTRKGMKRMRLRLLLVAEGTDALDYGLSWLNAVIDPDACGQVSEDCGTADLEWLSSCPPEREPGATDAEYADVIDRYWRILRSSAAESGPIVIGKNVRRGFYSYEVEIDFVSETPRVLGISRMIPLAPAAPSVVQDVVYNLVPTPSAELSDGLDVILQTNYARNPSVESNATYWIAGQVGLTPAVALARSTEVAAVGVASAKSSVVATNSGTNGLIGAYQDIPLPIYVAGETDSFSMWGFLTRIAGTATLTGLRFDVEWRTPTTPVSTVTIGTGSASGEAISATSVARPPTATVARCIMWGEVASWSAGASLNLFADALVVSRP